MRNRYFVWAFALLVLVLVAAPVIAAPPEKPVITSPGGGEVYNTHSPLLEWTEGAGATEYDIVIRNALNAVVFKKKGLAAGDVCTEGACSYSLATEEPPFSFLNGTYTWNVLGKNVDGRNRSAKATFIIDFPGKPTLVSPDKNATTGTTPVFSWNTVDAAEEYTVVVNHPSTGVKLISIPLTPVEVCIGDVCTFSFNSIFRPGTYRWWVQAKQITFPNVSKSERRKIKVVNNPLLP